MAEEIHTHEHEHVNDSSNAVMILAVVIALFLIGFLLWRFLPGRATISPNSINVNLPGNTSQQPAY